jgi:hypothetical protein
LTLKLSSPIQHNSVTILPPWIKNINIIAAQALMEIRGGGF